MNLKVFSKNDRLHQCTNCGVIDTWKRGWIWKGSWKDLDEGKIQKFCSVKCAREYRDGQKHEHGINKS